MLYLLVLYLGVEQTVQMQVMAWVQEMDFDQPKQRDQKQEVQSAGSK